MQNDITIVGDGIGGLTTALTLKQIGLQCHVYESASELKPAGAGIIIANNAMQIFKSLALSKQLEMVGNRISQMNVTDEKLQVLSASNLFTFEQKYGVSNIAIHRADLQQMLIKELSYDHIQHSKKLINIEKSISNWKLTFDNKTCINTNSLIGGDGIKLAVRHQVFDDRAYRSANQKCFRGICHRELESKYAHELNEMWGKGKRLGFVKSVVNTSWAISKMAHIENNWLIKARNQLMKNAPEFANQKQFEKNYKID